MDDKLQDLKKEIRKLLKLDFIIPDEIPNIDLYMEQVTTFMDKHLKNNLRSEGDKTLTKTMINNYTKNNLLPPPEKKKYNREHIILLIYIYYLKNVVSINDVRKLLEPLTDKSTFSDEDLYELYKATYEMEKSEYFNIENSVVRTSQIAEKKFPKDENDYFHKIAFIYLLGYDIFSKKRLIEKLIDELDEPEELK